MVFIGGSLKGAKAPCRKMGTYKAKPYYQGGWEKYNKINNSRIIGQSRKIICCPINNVKWLIIALSNKSCSGCGDLWFKILEWLGIGDYIMLL